MLILGITFRASFLIFLALLFCAYLAFGIGGVLAVTVALVLVHKVA